VPGGGCGCTVPYMPHSLPIFDATDAWITPPVAISVCALLFTVASFWWIQARRGRLRLHTGHVLSGALAKKAIVYLPFVFHNPSPATLTVVDLRLIIEGGSGGPEDTDRLVSPGKLFWIASHEAVYPESRESTGSTLCRSQLKDARRSGGSLSSSGRVNGQS
jgi:hypothetical protein